MASSASVRVTSSSSLKFEPPVGFGIDGQDIGDVDDAAALAHVLGRRVALLGAVLRFWLGFLSGRGRRQSGSLRC
jgi:hypothetical protein